MNDELAARQRAISLRLAGRSVKALCSAVGRSEVWFHKWWRRYLEAGPEGLYDLTHANQHVAQRIPPELERAILSIRRRLQAHARAAKRAFLFLAKRHHPDQGGAHQDFLRLKEAYDRALAAWRRAAA